MGKPRYKASQGLAPLLRENWVWIHIINNYWARWVKYRDLSVASRSIICRSRRLRQIIVGQDTDKSRHFAVTEFNTCFIIRSPFFWSTKHVKSLSASSGTRSSIFTQERSFNYACAEYYLQQNTYCRSHGELSANEKEGKIHRMIRRFIRGDLLDCRLQKSSGLKSSDACKKYSVLSVSYTHLRAHETRSNLVCRLLLEKKK